MIRRMIKGTWALTGLVLFCMLALKATPTVGPIVEAAVAPIRVNNANLGMRRYADRICWTWASDKLRPAFSDDVDIHLDVIDDRGETTNTFVPALRREDTGDPWQSGLSVGVGHWEFPYCVDVPGHLIGNTSIRYRVRFTPQFRGWHALWTIPIWTPDIVVPPGATR